MPLRLLLPLGAIVLLAGGVGASLLVQKLFLRGADPANGTTSCAIGSATYLQTSDLGTFDMITDQTYRQAPFHGQRGGVTPLPFVALFETGRLRGYIADLAVTGPYRKSEDDLARSLGYPIGKWPLVPLQGPVVQGNPGILEVYQSNWVFRSEQGAAAYLAHSRSSIAIDPNGAEIYPQGVGSSVVAYRSTLGSPDAQHERLINIASQQGTVVVQIAFQGGQALTEEQVVPLMQVALRRLGQACPTAKKQ